MASEVRSVYEQYQPLSRFSRWIIWPLAGVSCLAGGLILAHLAGVESYPAVLLIVAIGTAAVPLGTTWSCHKFQEVMESLNTLLWPSTSDCQEWIHNKSRAIFTLETRSSRTLSFFFFACAFLTYLLMDFPQGLEGNRLILLLAATPVLVFCGNCAYLMIVLIGAVHEVSRRSILTAPFFRSPHPGTIRVQAFYSACAIIIAISYVCMVMCALLGPYELGFELKVWALTIALYPVGLFVFSLFSMHVILKNIKSHNISIVNEGLQRLFAVTPEIDTDTDLEKLDRMMSIQRQVESMHEWPHAIGGTITFISTLALAVAQVTATVLSLRP